MVCFLKNVSQIALGVENDGVSRRFPCPHNQTYIFITTSYSILFTHYVIRYHKVTYCISLYHNVAYLAKHFSACLGWHCTWGSICCERCGAPRSLQILDDQDDILCSFFVHVIAYVRIIVHFAWNCRELPGEWWCFLKNVSQTASGVENDGVLQEIPMSTQSNLHFYYYFLLLVYLTPSGSHIMS